MFRHSAMIGLASFAVAILAPAPTLHAQTSPALPSTSASALPPVLATETPVGPRIRSVGITRAELAPGLPSVTQGSPARRDFAWMVLGGATVIVGSIVGGDGGTIIMVTGGVIGLIGLWRYLQYS